MLSYSDNRSTGVNRTMKAVFGLLGLVVGILLHAPIYAGEPTPKTVLVTGASSGIGLSITEALSSNGYLVYAGARKDEDLKRLDAMDNVESIRLDVTEQSEIDAAAALIRKKGRGLHGLVNNAGVVLMGPLIEVPVEELEWVFDVNVYGPYRVTKAFAPLLIESQGRIINISSITGFISGGLQGHYSMSKHALEAYTDSLAAELARFGVHVSAIEPGDFESNAGRSAVARLQENGYWNKSSRYADELEILTASIENKKTGRDPEAVADAVMHALSSDTPRRRYLVASALVSTMTLRGAMERILQMNQGQPHSKSSKQLSAMIDSLSKQLDQEGS